MYLTVHEKEKSRDKDERFEKLSIYTQVPDIISKRRYASLDNSMTKVVIRIIPITTQTDTSNQLIYLALGLVSICKLERKYSLKKRYNAGTEALANRKSSGILKKKVFDKPISDQWHSNKIIKRLVFFENKSSKPMVKVTTEQGMTGEVIPGKLRPLNVEKTGYMNGISNNK